VTIATKVILVIFVFQRNNNLKLNNLIAKVGTGVSRGWTNWKHKNISNLLMDKGSLRTSLKYLIIKELGNNST
jgi:hypothetical protein